MCSEAVFFWLAKKTSNTMTWPKQYAVVMLTEVIRPGANPYKCVPKTWLVFRSSGEVILPYPTTEQLPLSMDLIINYAQPVLSWPSHVATFVCEVDTYDQGLFFITHIDDNMLEEYAIMVWREISREVRERLSRRQSIFRKCLSGNRLVGKKVSQAPTQKKLLETTIGNSQKPIPQLTSPDDVTPDKKPEQWKKHKRSSESLASVQSFGSFITVWSASKPTNRSPSTFVPIMRSKKNVKM